MYPAATGVLGLSISSRPERGFVIAALGGELDIMAASMLRGKLIVMLNPAASRLIIDLSAVSYADASGLAVLVATGRRAGPLGGFLRLASPSPAAADARRLPVSIGISLSSPRCTPRSPTRSPWRPDGRPDLKRT